MDSGALPELSLDPKNVPTDRELEIQEPEREVAGGRAGATSRIAPETLPPLPRRNIEKLRRNLVSSQGNKDWKGLRNTVVFGTNLRENGGDILKPEPLLMVKVIVGGRLVDAMLDSGAQDCMIGVSLAEEMGLEVEGEECFIRGVGQNNWMKSFGTVELEVNIHGKEMKRELFLVVSQLDHPLLLGINFFVGNKILLNTALKRISTVNEDGSRDDLYLERSSCCCERILSKVPCRATGSAKLDSDTLVKLEVHAEIREGFTCPLRIELEEPEFYFDDSFSGRLEGLVQSWPGIVKLVEGNAEILVQKNVHHPVGIKKGDVVGHLYTVCNYDYPQILVNQVNVGVDGVEVPSKRLRLEEVVELDEGLGKVQKSQVYSMLEENSSVFSEGDCDLGRTSLTSYRIELYDDTPIRQRPRRFPDPVAEEIERQVKELELSDIVEPSSSPWSSPIVPVRKKDGSIRLCIDYRKLNRVTKPDRFPMPNLSDAVFGLHGARYFTSLDLVRGYYQMPLDDESRECTAFATTKGHFQFKRLSFGLKNAPAAFQREMQEVLRGFPSKRVIVYIDDILIIEENFESHLELVNKVLKTLGKHGIKIKPSKCQWFGREVQFLGHIVGRRGLKKSPEFIDKVRNFPQPETVQQLMAFLGLVNFQRKFIPRCSEIAAPLYGCTGGNPKSRLEWTSEMMEAFNILKDEVAKQVELAYPDYSLGARPLELSVDASGTGAGACLTQVQHGEERIIAYASMKFSIAQRVYSTVERELAGLRFGVKTFRAFLYGVHFVIYTDHRPLIYLHNMRLVDSRLARTLEDLADFSFDIKYKPGKENIIADTLSRIPGEGSAEPEVLEGHLPEGLGILMTVEGGGDSVFRSLWECLAFYKSNERGSELPADHCGLRVQLVDEILRHPTKYKLKTEGRGRKLVQAMKSPGVLPCNQVILAASVLYTKRIYVHYGIDAPVVYVGDETVPRGRDHRIHLQCLGGIHYNPLIESGDYVDLGGEADETIWEPPGDEVKDSRTDYELHYYMEDLRDPLLETLPSCGHQGGGVAWTWFKVGEMRFCALLDTGAMISLMAEGVMEKVKSMKDSTYEEHQLTACIRGIGSVKTPVTRCLVLSMVTPYGDYKFPFAVVPDDSIPYCCLLGLNFLKQSGLELDFTKGVIYEGLGCRRGMLALLEDVTDNNMEEDGYAFQVEKDGNLAQEDLKLVSHLFDPLELRRIQESDVGLRKAKLLIQKMDMGQEWKSIPEYSRYRQRLGVKDNVLCYSQTLENYAVVVPFRALVYIVVAVHREMAHLGRMKLGEYVARYVWHPSLSRVVKDVSRSCPQCQLYKVGRKVIVSPVFKIMTSCPFELVAVDLVAFPVTRRGNRACLVAVDHFSKWVMAVALRDKRAETVVKAMEDHVLPTFLRTPFNLLSDNGPEFRSRCFEELLEAYGIKHIYTSPYRPGSNGAVERVNRTIGEFLRSLLIRGGEWDIKLARAIIVYNQTVHTQICQSPAAKLLEGSYKSKGMLPLDLKEINTWREGHPKFVPFEVGQRVVCKIISSDRSVGRKFMAKYRGPFEITAVRGNGVAYEMVEYPPIEGSVIVKAHYQHLLPWRLPPEYLSEYFSLARVQTEGDECLSARKADDTLTEEKSRTPMKKTKRGRGVRFDLRDKGGSKTKLSRSRSSELMSKVDDSRMDDVGFGELLAEAVMGLSSELMEIGTAVGSEYPYERRDVGVQVGVQYVDKAVQVEPLLLMQGEDLEQSLNCFSPIAVDSRMLRLCYLEEDNWSVSGIAGDDEELDDTEGLSAFNRRSRLPIDDLNTAFRNCESTVGSEQSEFMLGDVSETPEEDRRRGSLGISLGPVTDSIEEMKEIIDDYMSRRKVSTPVGVGDTLGRDYERHTRSKGGVLELPNVQVRTLEFKRRGKRGK